MKSYKGLKAKADKLFSEVIRSSGVCENCGSISYLQTAHIISRRYNATRTDVRNAFCLCAKCHRFFTDHPREFSRFITRTWAQNHYDALFGTYRRVKKIDWAERIEFLKRIKNGELTLQEAREIET